MRILFKQVCITAMIFFSMQAGIAQKPAGKNSITAVQKFKPPKLYTTLGSFKDSSLVSVERAEAIIAMPLKIADAKNKEYSISSYQFIYKRREVTEDEQTGKTSPTSSISSDRFKTTPLPELWVNTIRDELKPGEELFFFDIIVKDTQGRVMYAPDLKIIVQ